MNINELSSYPVWTALITPFLPNGKIDFDSLHQLLNIQDKAKNGILLLGSTGEAMTLSLDEKKEILNLAINKKLSVPLMAGVGGINYPEMVEWVHYLNTLNLDCYLMVTPLYAKPGAKGQEHWFRSLLDVAKKPCMLYNIPGRSAVALHPLCVQALKDHPQFWAIKEASGSITDYQKFLEVAPNIRLYSGDDGMTPHFAVYGCHGVVSVASNVWAAETHHFAKLSLEGKTQSFWPTWSEAPKSLFSASNPIPVKALMAKIGMIKTHILRPPLSHLDLPAIEPLMKAHEMITIWSKQNE